MKCPYCGGEASGPKCPYCNSDLSDLMKTNTSGSGRGDDDYDDEDFEITDDMIKEIKEICREFQADHPGEFSCYELNNGEDVLVAGRGVKSLLFDVLDIPDDEEVFLIHDDTMLHSGKNGFAITDGGFYCLENGEELVVTDFEDIEDDDEVNYDSTTVYLEDDETTLCYFTGDSDTLEDLCDLCDDIIDVLFDAE